MTLCSILPSVFAKSIALFYLNVHASPQTVHRRLAQIDKAMLTLRATSVPGAVLSLEWMRAEIVAADCEDVPFDDLFVCLIDGALDVLRREVVSRQSFSPGG